MEVDPDARARLAALGYVGTFVATARRRIAPALADPKDKIELFNLMTQARETARHDKESDEGLHALERVVAQDPKVIDAWFMLGNEYYRRRSSRSAIEQFKRALALKPDYDLVVINMANAYRALGRDEEAMVGYRRFMELDPKNAQIRYEAAQILIDSGKLDEARQELTAGAGARAEAGGGAQRARRAARCAAATSRGAEREIRAAIAREGRRPARALTISRCSPSSRATCRARDRRVQEGDRAAPEQLQGGVQSRTALRAAGDRAGAARRVPAARSTMNPSFAEGHLFLAKAYLDSGTAGRSGPAGAQGLELEPTRGVRAARAITSSPTCSRARDAARRPNGRRRAARRSNALSSNDRAFGRTGLS